jgi:hypothetical protein
VNFSRAGRLILTSGHSWSPAFSDALVGAIRGQMLRDLARRVSIERWNEPSSRSGAAAGWLALADIFHAGWAYQPDDAQTVA